MRCAPLIAALTLAAGIAHANTMDQAFDAFERGDTLTAVAIWKTLAADGNATAQLNLGQVYRQGKGIPQDDSEAITWYTLAARNGSETARYTLALMHEHGRATEADLVAAGINSSTEMGPTETASPVETKAPPPQPINWLAAQPADTWLIQLIAASAEKSVQEFATRNLNPDIHPYRVVQSPADERRLYRLVIGPYSSQQEATAAASTLSAEATALKPWVRTTKSLQ
ncbi:SPOR domain-containing protein [Halioglobus maricola]|uniref:SPOR domain-containing protein n=1 Tax=Halioglobus maricola TaxID=2601894 RepID=UPI001478AE78|nr:SPOR domain-containing protein [Halioglobus maricola]